MNRQEKEALQDFLQELMQATVSQKDREADSMIYQAVARQPDAPYLLVQRSLLQEQALDAARREIAALRSQIEQARSSGNPGFLDDGSSWGKGSRRYSSVQPATSIPAERMQAASPSYGYSQGNFAGGYYPGSSRPGLLGGGIGSFLGSMAATAAGVAAGSFLFHGIDELMHDHDHSGGTGLADLGSDQSSQFMDDAGADYGGLAGDAGIGDIGDIGGMDDYS